MNLNFIATSSVLKEGLIPAKKSFNTLMIVKIDAGKAGTFEQYTSSQQAENNGVDGDLLTALQVIFSQERAPYFLKIGYVADLTSSELSILASATDWYFTSFLDSEMTDGNCVEVGNWLGSAKKMGVVTDVNDGALDKSAGITKAIFDAKLDHLFAIYAPNEDNKRFVSFALAGAMASVDFANEDSFYTVPHLLSNIVGVDSINITPTQRADLTGYVINVGVDPAVGIRGNFYGEYEGFDFIMEGLMPNGALISEVAFVDWLNYTVKFDTATYFKNNKITSYRDKDLAGIILNYKRSLLKGVRAGGLIEDQIKTVTLQSLKDILNDSPELRSQHLLPQLTAQIKCSGAIHHVNYQAQCVPFGTELNN